MPDKISKFALIFSLSLFLLVILAPITLALEQVEFIPNITIQGSQFQKDVPYVIQADQAQNSNLMGEYMSALYKFSVGIAGILAVVMIAYGGIVWTFSGGDSGKIGKAKEIIVGAVIGLALALGSYLILSTINPKLVILHTDKLTPIHQIALSREWCKDITLPNDTPDAFIEEVSGGSAGVSKESTLCGKTYGIPGLSGSVCQGASGCKTDEICNRQILKTGRTAVVQSDKPMMCQSGKELCGKISDDTTSSLGLPDSQQACDYLNILKDDGSCLWVDATIVDDSCVFFPVNWLDDYCLGNEINSCGDYSSLSSIADIELFRISNLLSNVDLDSFIGTALCKNDVCAYYNQRSSLNCKVVPTQGGTVCAD